MIPIGSARPLFAVVLALSLSMAGCATHKDMVRIEQTMSELDERHEARYRALLEQQKKHQAAVIEQINGSTAELSAEIKRELRSTEKQLSRIEELSGYGQQSVAEMIRSLESRISEGRQPAPHAPGMTSDPAQVRACPAEASAGSILDLTEQLVTRKAKNVAIAREGAEEYLRCFSNKPGAAKARFLEAETYAMEKKDAEASRRFGLVAEQYHTSAHAPAALNRQAEIALASGDRIAAERLYETTVRSYPRSPEARKAEAALIRLRGKPRQ